MYRKAVIRYSESFKLQVVRELEEGRHTSPYAAQEAYGIRGNGTVRRWAEQYGRDHLIGRVIRVETPEEGNELRRLKSKIRELERALGDTTLDLMLERAYVNIACRRAGIEDVEEFKKKRVGRCPRCQRGEQAGNQRWREGALSSGRNESAELLRLPEEPPTACRR